MQVCVRNIVCVGIFNILEYLERSHSRKQRLNVCVKCVRLFSQHVLLWSSSPQTFFSEIPFHSAEVLWNFWKWPFSLKLFKILFLTALVWRTVALRRDAPHEYSARPRQTRPLSPSSIVALCVSITMLIKVVVGLRQCSRRHSSKITFDKITSNQAK